MRYELDAIAVEALKHLQSDAKLAGSAFDESLGIPLLGEAERIKELWQSLMGALDQSSKSQIIIVFVNERIGDSGEYSRSNLNSLDFFSVPRDLPVASKSMGRDHFVLVNGCLDQFKLKTDEGVGRARKVVADLALGLHHRKVIRTDLHRQTDADVLLPAEYFQVTLELHWAGATYPFTHCQGELSDTEHQNLKIYERWLQSYSEGLEAAGSPYAFAALGSTLFFRLKDYEAVRGIPNVRAGEDFHFLSKLRKRGVIGKFREPCLEIRGRHSLRVPFGTGRALEELRLQRKAYEPYPAQVFQKLKHVLGRIDDYAAHGSIERFMESLDPRSQIFFAGFLPSFSRIQSQNVQTSQKQKWLHEKFDALATYKWVKSQIAG